MGFFDVFKRSRKEINRSNQEQGKDGEEQVKAKYELNGYKVTRTGKGLPKGYNELWINF
jgi:hypothetical protein